MKLALMTLNIGACLCENSRASFKAAVNRWGAEYVEITECFPGSTPHAAKLKAFELCPDADRIFYIDADTIIRADCPSPFDWQEDQFVGVLNDTEHMPENVRCDNAEVYEQDMKRIFTVYPEVEYQKHTFLNSGMWLASRKYHVPLLVLAHAVSMRMDGVTAWRDQTALNWAILALKPPVLIADPTWNYQFPPHTGEQPMTELIYYWAGQQVSRLTEPERTNWQAGAECGPVVSGLRSLCKPRLLWIGDAIVPTGFARVTHNICGHLVRNWDLSVIGINFMGDPHDYPYKIYPGKNGGDIWGIGRYRELFDFIRPDAVVVNNDPWIVARFCEVDRGGIPLAAYMPVDARNIPDHICRQLNNLDLAIFYTDFGKREVESAGYHGQSRVIPHGVDSALYRPIPQKEAQEEVGIDLLPEDSFIVGNVNRNQPRKRLDLTVQYFAEWVHQYRLPPNVYLYIHCAQQDSGWNLAQLAAYYGVNDRLMLPAIEIVTASCGLPEDRMPYVYGCFDVQVTTTMGEGWGLCQAEGMACGIPQIVPQYSALGEWAAGAAMMVPCTSHESHIGINTIGGVPDKAEFIRALHRMYTDSNLRREMGEKALARAREPRFKWEKVADQFQQHLGQMLIDARTKATAPKETQEVASGIAK